MIIKITQYCDQGCWHCMHSCTTQGKHMDLETYQKALKFASLITPLKSLSISGGEPTEHPEIFAILELALNQQLKDRYLNNRYEVILISNGDFLWKWDKEKLERLFELLTEHDDFIIQVTSIPGIYRTYEKVKQKLGEIKEEYDIIFDIEKIMFYDKNLEIIPIGRAKENLKFHPEAFEARRQGTSCFNMYSVLKSTSINGVGDILSAINYTKANTIHSFCKPMVIETGEIKFGEYQTCSTIINLNDHSLDEITPELFVRQLKYISGPCGNCVNNQNQRNNLKLIEDVFQPHDIIDVEIEETILEQNNKNLLPVK